MHQGRWLGLLLALSGLAQAAPPTPSTLPALPDAAALAAEVAHALSATQANGLALAVIDDGKVVYVRAHGKRNAAGEPLGTDTVMYGASLTKTAFAHLVMQLVDEGRIVLDRPIASYLDKPLPDYPAERNYARWADLAGDERWRLLTPRLLLSHGGGFGNFAFLEPDRKLRMHFAPGSRYAYSGEGLMLLQFVLERGLAIDVGQEMQRRIFDRFGMPRTSMTWRADFAANAADGWTLDGSTRPHGRSRRVRAAGSMDTTIADMATFAAAYVNGVGLSAAGAAERVAPGLPITTASQFPTLQAELPPAQRRADLAAGLGVVSFRGPHGAGFYKGGHDDGTGNTFVCVVGPKRCVVILANDVRAEAAFPRLVAAVLGEAGVPWTWEYGAMRFVR